MFLRQSEYSKIVLNPLETKYLNNIQDVIETLGKTLTGIFHVGQKSNWDWMNQTFAVWTGQHKDMLKIISASDDIFKMFEWTW